MFSYCPWFCYGIHKRDVPPTLKDLIDNGIDIKELALSEYPIFDEDYRGILNEKIIAYYKYRPICDFNVELFIDLLKNAMLLIIDEFNLKYKYAFWEYGLNPYDNYAFTENRDGESTSENNGNSTNDRNVDMRECNSEIGQAGNTTTYNTTNTVDLKGTNNTTGDNTITSNSKSNGSNERRNTGNQETNTEGSDLPYSYYTSNTNRSYATEAGRSNRVDNLTQNEQNESVTDSSSSDKIDTKNNTTNTGTTKNTGTDRIDAISANKGTTTNRGTTKDSSNSSGSTNTSDSYIRKLSGYSSQLPIDTYKKILYNIVNIDLILIKSRLLSDCFYGLRN